MKLTIGVLLIILLGAYLITQDWGLVGGIALASLLGIFLYQYQLRQEWEGTIREIKNINYYDSKSEMHRTKTVMILELSNGKSKKMNAVPGRKVGDTIKKEKGKSSPEKVG